MIFVCQYRKNCQSKPLLLKCNYRLVASNLLTNYPKRLEEIDELEMAIFSFAIHKNLLNFLNK